MSCWSRSIDFRTTRGPNRHSKPARHGRRDLECPSLSEQRNRRDSMTFSGVAHVSLTVTDLERSKRWYAELLGWEEMMAGESDGVSFGVGVLPGGQLLALRQHADGTGDNFDPRRT